MGTDGVIDRQRFAELARVPGDNGTPLLQELLVTFRSGAARYLGSMTMAIHERDLAGVHRAAHSLRGSSSTVGAPELERIAAALEKAAAEQKMLEVKTAIDAASDALLRFEAEAARYTP